MERTPPGDFQKSLNMERTPPGDFQKSLTMRTAPRGIRKSLPNYTNGSSIKIHGLVWWKFFSISFTTFFLTQLCSVEAAINGSVIWPPKSVFTFKKTVERFTVNRGIPDGKFEPNKLLNPNFVVQVYGDLCHRWHYRTFKAVAGDKLILCDKYYRLCSTTGQVRRNYWEMYREPEMMGMVRIQYVPRERTLCCVPLECLIPEEKNHSFFIFASSILKMIDDGRLELENREIVEKEILEKRVITSWEDQPHLWQHSFPEKAAQMYVSKEHERLKKDPSMDTIKYFLNCDVIAAVGMRKSRPISRNSKAYYDFERGNDAENHLNESWYLRIRVKDPETQEEHCGIIYPSSGRFYDFSKKHARCLLTITWGTGEGVPMQEVSHVVKVKHLLDLMKDDENRMRCYSHSCDAFGEKNIQDPFKYANCKWFVSQAIIWLGIENNPMQWNNAQLFQGRVYRKGEIQAGMKVRLKHMTEEPVTITEDKGILCANGAPLETVEIDDIIFYKDICKIEDLATEVTGAKRWEWPYRRGQIRASLYAYTNGLLWNGSEGQRFVPQPIYLNGGYNTFAKLGLMIKFKKRAITKIN